MTACCARCDWTHDPAEDPQPPRDALTAHAATSGHPLCPCCQHSLTRTDPAMGCETCLTRSRELLAGIVTLWIELPAHMGPRGSGYDRTPGAADGQPLPGGNAIVLHGPGGVGYAHVGDVHRDTDPPSVAHSLATWHDDWLHLRSEPAAVVAGGRGGTGPTLRAASRYLEIHARWAANSHPAFDEYLSDLKSLHAQLENATSRSQRRIIAEADCFECAGDLERQVTESGYDDQWTCQRCGRRYSWESYLLALRAKLEEAS